MANLYQSDVTAMTDEDLRILSEELENTYLHSYTLPCECCTESEWSDDDAESRYREMRREITRRWEIANPEEAERRRKIPILSPALISRVFLEAFTTDKLVARFIASQDAKVGDTITVRRPYRFTAGG